MTDWSFSLLTGPSKVIDRTFDFPRVVKCLDVANQIRFLEQWSNDVDIECKEWVVIRVYKEFVQGGREVCSEKLLPFVFVDSQVVSALRANQTLVLLWNWGQSSGTSSNSTPRPHGVSIVKLVQIIVVQCGHYDRPARDVRTSYPNTNNETIVELCSCNSWVGSGRQRWLVIGAVRGHD